MELLVFDHTKIIVRQKIIVEVHNTYIRKILRSHMFTILIRCSKRNIKRLNYFFQFLVII